MRDSQGALHKSHGGSHRNYEDRDALSAGACAVLREPGLGKTDPEKRGYVAGIDPVTDRPPTPKTPTETPEVLTGVYDYSKPSSISRGIAVATSWWRSRRLPSSRASNPTRGGLLRLRVGQ